ncbi:MAG: hypothetical protein J1F67_09030 [Muribaculaceae bacterium]|nr:hypothetical protein [Muribaculaceae bacterium]
MDKYENFKSLLEYFVSHLEWVINQDKNHPGYAKYIAPISSFKISGQGYNGHKIQNQIMNWNNYDGEIISITVSGTYPQRRGSYLHWDRTWENIRAKWNNNHITELYISTEDSANAKPVEIMTLTSLGLFDDRDPNNNLKRF